MKIEIILYAIIGLVLLSLIPISAIIAYSTDEFVTFTVEEKERIQDGDSSYYLIFTDKGVYKNDDSLWYWKWNSSDVYNDLEVGQQYGVRVYGFRVPFLSWYKNIISVHNPMLEITTLELKPNK